MQRNTTLFTLLRRKITHLCNHLLLLHVQEHIVLSKMYLYQDSNVFWHEATYLSEWFPNLQWNVVPLKHWGLSTSDTKLSCKSPKSSDTRQRKSDVSRVAVIIKVVAEKMSDGSSAVIGTTHCNLDRYEVLQSNFSMTNYKRIITQFK